MDFARVLLVGVVILAVMIVFFGGEFGGFGGGEGGPGYQFGPVHVPEKETEVTEKGGELTGAFFVGQENETDYKHFTVSDEPFSVSFKKRKSVLGELKNTTVKKGFLSDRSQEITFNLTKSQLNKLTSLSLRYVVEDTNSFGKLFIDLNGKEIFSGYPTPGQTESLKTNSSLLRKNNVLTISAGSSGMKFWAPTIYKLNNFTVSSKILGRERKNFIFSLTKKQARNFEKGRIVLRPEEIKGDAPLVIQVNGRDVYRKRMKKPSTASVWVDFEDAEMKEGKNRLTFSTDYNSTYRFRSGSFIVFWTSRTEGTTTKTLDVTSGQHSRLPGKMSFKIERIEGSPTSLNLNIIKPDGEENRILIQEVLKEGKTVSIDITEDEIDEGKNKIQFIVEGDGGFYLKNFEVNY